MASPRPVTVGAQCVRRGIRTLLRPGRRQDRPDHADGRPRHRPGGAFLRSWRLLAIDGFEVDLPDSKENAAEFGYAGSGENRSAFPNARVVALAECGIHAFLAAEIGDYATGEKTLAAKLYPRLRDVEHHEIRFWR